MYNKAVEKVAGKNAKNSVSVFRSGYKKGNIGAIKSGVVKGWLETIGAVTEINARKFQANKNDMDRERSQQIDYEGL